MNLFDVNWIAIVVAALAGFLVGGIWYGPVMGKRWMGAVGLTEDQIKSGNMGAIYGGAFAFSLLASWTLAHTFASYMMDMSLAVKVMTAFGVALGFILPAIGTNYLFSQKSKALFFYRCGLLAAVLYRDGRCTRLIRLETVSLPVARPPRYAC